MVRNFDPKRLQQVPIMVVRPNTWNPKARDTEEFKKIKKGIQEKGLRLPIPVRQKREGESLFEIIDGEQRFRAAKELRHEKVVVYNEGELSDQEAKELTIWYQQQVPFDEVKLAGLVMEIAAGGEFSLPYSEEEINVYRDMLNFSWDALGTAELVLTESDPSQIVTLKIPESVISDIRNLLEEAPQPTEGGVPVRIVTTRPLLITHAQKEVVERALNTVKSQQNVKDGRALELICADYLSGSEQ